MLVREYHCYTCDADFEVREGGAQANFRQLCPGCSRRNTQRKRASAYVINRPAARLTMPHPM